MNPETQEFEPVKGKIIEGRDERGWPVFTIGQQITLNGVHLRLRKISRKDLIFRPVREDKP